MPAPTTEASAERIAAFYFLPPPDGFWRWSEAGDAAEWTSDGKLIAFHEEIEAVLRALSRHGLPPFATVLLFIAACRDTWGTGSVRCASLSSYQNTLDSHLIDRNLPPGWPDLLNDGLAKIHHLPADLRRTPQAKADLADHLFELPASQTDFAALTVDAFANGLVARLFARDAPEHEFAAGLSASQNKEISTSRFIAAVEALLSSFQSIDEKSIRNRRATGLDSTPEPAPIEVGDTRPLIEQLQNDTDPDLRLLGEIAHQLAAAVHLPKPPSTPDELPLGGFSDVSNRGSLDRLLVSELALDELSLTVRLAMNEALYLRRESPPKAPARHRVLLVDNGIRLWGVPRVFAAAVALAFTQNTDGDEPAEAFAPGTDSPNLNPVVLTDRESLLTFLGTLTPHIHPAETWANLLEQFPEKDHGDTDFILVTHSESAVDHGFIATSETFRHRDFHLATVDICGAYALWNCTPSGRQKIASAKLDLEAIVADQSTNANRLRDDSNSDLPVFYRLDQTPLRIAYPVASTLYLSGRVTTHAHFGHFVAAPRDGRLLYWENTETGARLLSAFAPSDDLLWLGIDPHLTTDSPPRWVGQIQIQQNPTGGIASAILEITHITDGGQSVTRFAADFDTTLGTPVHTYHTADHLALFWQRQTDVISLQDGTLLSRREHSHDLVKGSGPYVEFEGENWFHYTHTPQGIYFERPTQNKSELAAVWNVPGSEEPFAIAAEGPPRPIGKMSSSKPVGAAPTYVSADGKRAVSGRSGTRTAFQLTSAGFAPISSTGDFLAILEPHIAKSTDQTPTVRRQFNGIAATASGTIFLRSHRGSFSKLTFSATHLYLANAQRPENVDVVPFGALHHVPDHLAGLELKVATWPDGTRAYIDRNAFLHLCPADTSRPEITLVLLAQGAIPFWTSDELLIENPHPFFGGSLDSESLRPHLQSIAQSAALQ